MHYLVCRTLLCYTPNKYLNKAVSLEYSALKHETHEILVTKVNEQANSFLYETYGD
jgi:hypothetical protein